MRIGKLSLINFQSYENLEFDFNGQGLTGIFGTTGAGKSTLMDGLAWALFAVTGKGVASDDVRSWQAGELLTEAYLRVELQSGSILVSRIRGGSGRNDLYWREYQGPDGKPSDAIRGKDLKDTQKKLEERLGVTADLFLLSSYMTQFSDADSFFISSAKSRREVLEKIADQEWAIKLGERAAEHRKAAKKGVEELQLDLARNTGALESARRTLAQTWTNALQWDQGLETRVGILRSRIASYKSDMEAKQAAWEKESAVKLDALVVELDSVPDPVPDAYFEKELELLHCSSRCETCGSLSDKHHAAIQKVKESKLKNSHYREKLTRLSKEYQTEGAKLCPYKITDNPYEHQLEEAIEEANPFTSNVAIHEEEILASETIINAINCDLKYLETRISHLTWLYDKSFILRGLMMERVVRQIEKNTNDYMEHFFDGALRIRLQCQDSDKIEVEIQNNGHRCGFLALSGGERTMLKLSFGLSLMKAAQNKAGVAINCLMLDEPLNGLPEDLKVKAFGLFEQLTGEFETILVIDHSEAFKACFTNAYYVDKCNGKSVLSNL